MFCPKCGTKALDGAGFCQKCGAKLTANDVTQKAPGTPIQQVPQTQSQPGSAPVDAPKKKKFKKLPIILGAVAIAIVAIIAIALNWKGKIDYEATVRAYTPYAESQGIPYSCGEVFDKYIPDASWKVRESSGMHYVDISGTAKGLGKELSVTIQVEADEDRALMKPVSLKLDGDELIDNAFFALFVAYDEKDDDLSHLEELICEVDFALRGGELTGTFANEVEGISFSYPDWWVTLDSSSEYEIVKMISPRNNGNHVASFGVTVSLDSDPFGVFTGDEAFVRDSVNEYHTFLDYGDVMLGDIPAKALRYQTAGLNGDDVVVALGYTVGGNVYWVTCSYAESTSAVYESIFQAMIESYVVTAATNANNIYYKNESLTDWIGATAEDAYNAFGWPSFGTVIDGDMYAGGEYFAYQDGVMFLIDYQTNRIGWIMAEADVVDFNGVTLNKTRDELVTILGTPTSEDRYYNELEGTSGYMMEYYINGTVVGIDMADFTSRADTIYISQN